MHVTEEMLLAIPFARGESEGEGKVEETRFGSAADQRWGQQ